MEREKMTKLVSIAVLWVAAATSAYACDRPAAPDTIPDGKTAAMEDMMAAKKAVVVLKWPMEKSLS